MTHRPDCDQPTLEAERSQAVPHLTILRCPTCGAVELHTTTEEKP